MATLVLTKLGSVLGGPLGGAIGAFIGQQIDQSILLRPKARQGPRLGDLAVQTSFYGTAIPRLFGTMRVAGTVIWATDLREERTRSGGGKGQSKTTSYSYSASFAVALSARHIRRVGRIWADGKLLRGAAGDFKTATGFRLHLGDEGQAVDPLIAASEGLGRTPAYRGIAYAVFEDFQLADYGNRIPALTFEVEADAGPVSISTIAETLSDGEIGGAALRTVAGYAASGDSVRAAIETLARAAPLSLADTGERLDLVMGDAAPLHVAAADMGAVAGATPGARRDERRESAPSVPGEISLVYYEPARDYQTGLHRATRPGTAWGSERVELPAALGASEAKAIAEANLARRWTERTRRVARLPWRHIGIAPSDIVAIEDEPGLWRVAEAEIERMAVTLTLVRHRAESIIAAPEAEPGRPLPQIDKVHGPTVLHCFELPELGEGLAVAPRLIAAAAGTSPGWRGAALMTSLDGGTSWQEVGPTAGPAIVGTASSVLGEGQTACFDDIGTVDVTLLNDTMQLAAADAAGAGALTLSLEQIGSLAPSAPAARTIPFS